MIKFIPIIYTEATFVANVYIRFTVTACSAVLIQNYKASFLLTLYPYIIYT